MDLTPYMQKLVDCRTRDLELIKRYKGGEEPVLIQAKLNVTRQRFYQILDKHGVEYRQTKKRVSMVGKN